MSLYNMIFGENDKSTILLSAIGLKKEDFYRYRDAYLTENNNIAVYTRGGGGNRECNCETEDQNHTNSCVISMQDALRINKYYISDEDDGYDHTYATFYFKIPDKADFEGMDTEPDRNQFWDAFLRSVEGDHK